MARTLYKGLRIVSMNSHPEPSYSNGYTVPSSRNYCQRLRAIEVEKIVEDYGLDFAHVVRYLPFCLLANCEWYQEHSRGFVPGISE